PAFAATTYVIDPSHTYPSFEADHGGISYWRGKFNKTTGEVVLDRANETGTVNLTIDAASMDFGHNKMNEEAIGPKMLDTEQFPTITYVGKSMKFENGQPVEVVGELTMKGVTKPVNLTINKFKCKPHPFVKREVCGADAQTQINRSDFGVDYAVDMGFDPMVNVLISIEAIKQE
ncbi:MAG: YceI family protein, partial [Limnobacter sp.]|nr:YceI family protein [Limnobacter sp.]